MLAKLALGLALLGALAAAPAAAGDGPLFVTQGGAGIVAGATRYIPVANYQGNDTQLLAISTKDGTEQNQLALVGQWGLPATPSGPDGISTDGTRLVLAGMPSGQTSPSLFMVVNPKTLRIVKPITLQGYFSFDALSPDASKLYFIQYTHTRYGADLNHYIVRSYDLRTNTLLPGRVADRTQKSWVMQGSPVTRVKSADGRWVYTLYWNPGGYPFVHALDTVRGVAHCVGIPLANQKGIYNMVLSLHGKTLSVHWRSGRPFVNVNTTTWRVTPAHDGFPWLWVALGISLLACVSITCLLLARGRWAAASRRSWRPRVAGSRSTTASPAQSSAASAR